MSTVKLSVLQKAILRTAFRWDSTGYVTSADIKAEVFHWPVRFRRREYDRRSDTTTYYDFSTSLEPGTARFKADHLHFSNQCTHSQLFDRADIGAEAYNVACASISRSLRSLEKRGLLRRNGRFWALTQTGIETVNRQLYPDHLTVTAPVEMLPALTEEAKKRQNLSHGRGKKGRQVPDDLKGRATEQAGAIVGVSRNTVHRNCDEQGNVSI